MIKTFFSGHASLLQGFWETNVVLMLTVIQSSMCRGVLQTRPVNVSLEPLGTDHTVNLVSITRNLINEHLSLQCSCKSLHSVPNLRSVGKTNVGTFIVFLPNSETSTLMESMVEYNVVKTLSSRKHFTISNSQLDNNVIKSILSLQQLRPKTIPLQE